MKRKEPLYIKIREEIRALLARHTNPETPIPPENEFCNRFKVSRGTVRKAFEDLEREGIIHRIPGKGTFLASGSEKAEKRSLFTRRELIIVVLPCSEDLEKNHLSMFVFFEILRGITKACEAYGYQMHLIERPAYMNPDFGKQCANEIERNGAEGIIFLGGGMEYETEEFRKKKYPYVIIQGHLKPMHGENFVSTDTESAVKKAVEMLIKMGHKRIGCLSGAFDLLTFQLRLNGYRRALEENGLSYERELTLEGREGSIEEARQCAKKLLELKNPPSALFCATDIRALGAMEAIHEKGLRIPEDISIIGFDNIKESSETNPPLTTIEHPRFDLGYKSVELLSKLINGQVEAPASNLAESKIIRRKSCAPPLKKNRHLAV
jgi:LacI family repressor for deo operon, udp, cdd, tsx, nupC, and nupG